MSRQLHGKSAEWRFDAAARVAARLLPLFAACALALSGCAHFSKDSGPSSAASAQAQAAEEAKPPMQRGEEADARGDYAAAAAFYRKAHDADPAALDPLYHLGAAQVAGRDYTGAYETYHQAQTLSADDPEAAFRLGELMLMRGSPQAAIDQFTIALRSRKVDPALYSAIGVAYSMMGKYDLAIGDYRLGLKIAPDHMGLRNNLGLAQFLAGDYDGAVKTLSDLVALPDAKPRYRQNLAFIYAIHGDYEQARAVAGHDVDLASLKSDLDLYRNGQKINQQGGESKAINQELMGIHFSGKPMAVAPATAAVGTQTSQIRAQPSRAHPARAQPGRIRPNRDLSLGPGRQAPEPDADQKPLIYPSFHRLLTRVGQNHHRFVPHAGEGSAPDQDGAGRLA